MIKACPLEPTKMHVRFIAAFFLSTCLSGICYAQDPIFSGPQVGEKLDAFKVKGVFDDAAGKEIDFVTLAEGKPIVLIFVHEVNRPVAGMTRILSTYTASRVKDGLATGVVWLADDATAAENQLKTMRHALAKEAPIGISVDGKEGPGSYGLNRNVALTILVGKENKVTANFALVQPSLQADLPKILDAVVAVAGGKAPKLEDLEGMPAMNRNGPDMRSLLQPVINKSATEEQVIAAAKKVEDAASKDEVVRKELARITTAVINGGKFEDYGTPKAREYLKKWNAEYAPQAAAPGEKRTGDRK
jgi:hypothetical protein